MPHLLSAASELSNFPHHFGEVFWAEKDQRQQSDDKKLTAPDVQEFHIMLRWGNGKRRPCSVEGTTLTLWPLRYLSGTPLCGPPA